MPELTGDAVETMIEAAADAIAAGCEQECGDDLCHCEQQAALAVTAALARANTSLTGDDAPCSHLCYCERAGLIAENARLRAALKGIAEYCSGDDRTLGAIARLATIRNTAEQAARAHEQSAPAECAHVPMKNALDDGVSCIRCGADLGGQSPSAVAGPELGERH